MPPSKAKPVGVFQRMLRRYINEILKDDEDWSSWTEDGMLAALLQQHPDLKRQKQTPLRKEVNQAFAHCRQQLGSRSGTSGPASDDGPDALDDAADDSASEPLDNALPAEMMTVDDKSGNALNRMLQSRYKSHTDTMRKQQAQGGPPAPKRAKQTLAASILSNAALEDDYEPVAEVAIPSETYRSLGGIEDSLQDIRELVELTFTHPELFQHLGFHPPHGVLLHGPPGCGKTLLARAIAGELQVPMLAVAAPEIVGGTSGDSERSLRNLFRQAREVATQSKRGAILFLDEIDVITPKRETAQREMERRIVAQLLTCLDGLAMHADEDQLYPVMVLGATNRPDSIDPALRRAGRFDREICMSVPDAKARVHILHVMADKMRLASDVDFQHLATLTPGYVGADLKALVNEAGINAVSRGFHALQEQQQEEEKPKITTEKASSPSITPDEPLLEQSSVSTVEGAPFMNSTAANRSTSLPTSSAVIAASAMSARSRASDWLRAARQPFTELELAGFSVAMADFLLAVKRVQPSAKREGFATTPNVTWADVGALDQPRGELEEAIVFPLKNPELCAKLGTRSPPGVLLFGPPGCGKTLLAKALANGCAANFISIKGPELLNKFVGESERAVRQVFQRARTSSPCIVFFDELDALCPRRDDGSSSRVTERLVNQLLTELDGFDTDERRQVFVIGATNRPDMIDPAMLRPGRLEKLVYVDLPNEVARREILQTHLRHVAVADDVNLADVAGDERCQRFTGADLAALCREAGFVALRRVLATSGKGVDAVVDAPTILRSDFDGALGKVQGSVSQADLKKYRATAANIRAGASA